MAERILWEDLRGGPLTEDEQKIYEDEARIYEFQGLAHRLRTEAGLTEAELAARMGVTQQLVESIEEGGVRPTSELLEKLSSAVETSRVRSIR